MKLSATLALMFFLSQTTSVIGQEIEKAYSNAGTIDEIYAEEQKIIISDMTYNIITQVRVNHDGTQVFGLYNLAAGMPIGFNFDGPRRDAWISEVWLLDAPPVDTSVLDD